jgi:hypothetical protein
MKLDLSIASISELQIHFQMSLLNLNRMRSLRNDSDVGVSRIPRTVQAAEKYLALMFRSEVWICEDLVLQAINVQCEYIGLHPIHCPFK